MSRSWMTLCQKDGTIDFEITLAPALASKMTRGRTWVLAVIQIAPANYTSLR